MVALNYKRIALYEGAWPSGDCTGSWTQRFWEWKSHVLTDRRYSRIGASTQNRTENYGLQSRSYTV